MILTLQIGFRGLGLFVPRATHIDVIFPKFGTDDREHIPELSVSAWGKTRQIPDTVVDWRDIPVLESRPAPLEVPCLLPLDAAAHAPVRSDDAIYNRDLASGGFRLPYGTLRSMEWPVYGPWTYGGSSNVYITDGVLYTTGVLAPPDDRSVIREMLATIGVEQDATETTTTGSNDASDVRARTWQFEVDVSCTSKADATDMTPLRFGDRAHDVAAYGALLGRDLSGIGALPRYLGLERALSDPGKIEVKSTKTRPCPLARAVLV